MDSQVWSNSKDSWFLEYPGQQERPGSPADGVVRRCRVWAEE
jgi:hypothetical protein